MGLKTVVEEALDALEGDVRKRLAAEVSAVQGAVTAVNPAITKLKSDISAAVAAASPAVQEDVKKAVDAFETQLTGLFSNLL